MGISVYPPASGGITTRTLKQAVFNTSGTWTYPSSSKFDGTVEVTCVAGGGASGAARNRSGSTYIYGGGAGGGGQVILRKQLSVLGAGNQTVTVGAGGGGWHDGGGLFGHISSFGSGYIRNLYPDPALTKGLYGYNAAVGLPSYPETSATSNSPSIFNPNIWTSGTNPPQPPVGRTYVSLNLNSNSAIYSQYMSIKASTSYRIIYSHTFNSSGGATVDFYAMWFRQSGEYISETTLTGFTTQSSSGTWTAVTSTVTSPANAFYMRLGWNNGGAAANYRLTGIQVAETAASVTTVVSGSSSGYTWTGVPDNSYTVGENETLIAAQGGGGGWGITHRISNNGSPYMLPGHSGYTGGGLGLYISSTSIQSNDILITGSGGGAGGNASPQRTLTQTASAQPYTIVDSNAHAARHGYGTSNNGDDARFHAAIHSAAAYVGAPSTQYTKTTTDYPVTDFGQNGQGIEGYGYGGMGAARTSTSRYNNFFINSGSGNSFALIGFDNNYSPTSNGHQAAFLAKPNSGNGGSGWIGQVGSGDTDYKGVSGASGVVIVRWYE